MKTEIMEAEVAQSRWTAAMRAGDFESAWRQTDRIEERRRARGFRIEENGDLLWDGTPFHDRRVLIRCLHGLGDTLQFMRFAPRVAAVAEQVTLAVQPALMRLLREERRFGRVVDGWRPETWPEHDVEVEVMELPYALRLTTRDLPGPIPYLDVRAIERRSRFAPPPSDPSRPRVGLVWQASGWDSSRSIPVGALAALKGCAADFFSLQQETSPEVLEKMPIPVISLAERTRDPLDAARAMLWLDLIVTVDAMPAHLAGALGSPTWVILKSAADWRWMEGRKDSPWYPSMRLFRRDKSWEGVLEDLAAALSCRSGVW